MTCTSVQRQRSKELRHALRPTTPPTPLPPPARARARRRRRQRGITLLEIMIVLAIIGLVMGLLVGPAVMRAFGSSKTKIARIAVRKFAFEAYPQWAAEHARQEVPGQALRPDQ